MSSGTIKEKCDRAEGSFYCRMQDRATKRVLGRESGLDFAKRFACRHMLIFLAGGEGEWGVIMAYERGCPAATYSSLRGIHREFPPDCAGGIYPIWPRNRRTPFSTVLPWIRSHRRMRAELSRPTVRVASWRCGTDSARLESVPLVQNCGYWLEPLPEDEGEGEEELPAPDEDCPDALPCASPDFGSGTMTISSGSACMVASPQSLLVPAASKRQP